MVILNRKIRVSYYIFNLTFPSVNFLILRRDDATLYRLLFGVFSMGGALLDSLRMYVNTSTV